MRKPSSRAEALLVIIIFCLQLQRSFGAFLNRRPHQSLSRFTALSSSAAWYHHHTTITMSNNDDEFGDASFLDDFDVDQAVSQYQQRASIQSAASSISTASAQNENDSKRRKISASPYGKQEPEKNNDTSLLTETLQRFFGYPTFRNGQLAVIQKILHHKQDVAVFWATGQGKSLCYQIPALVNEQRNVVVVVSPLISLMQDQCHKLNALSSSSTKEIAVFLGSAQNDGNAEQKAINGEYNLIYVTPEKLCGSSFLNNLARNLQDRLCLFAIDEAHCVSEWGFDFRPEFRKVGNELRDHPVLSKVPILALTATAVPRVQQDIIDSLKLVKPFTAKQSFDRNNLKIKVARKTGGVATAMKSLLQVLNAPNVRASKQSTIVYAPTRSQVEEVTMYLQANIKNDSVKVEAYHAGLSSAARALAHNNFLTGKTAVIVATVAFGMGIDKPDTRTVIHYGSPKTLEEYYQQIGRAGRDGLPADCIMYISEGDFDRYKSDFYLGGLTGKARQATLNSMAALRSFSLDAETCRRKALLTYFDETPAFGERCGTCDTCQNVATYGDDTQRDFGPLGAKIVLYAISSLNEQGLTNIIKVISGSTVEGFRYKRGTLAASVQKAITTGKEALPKKYPQAHYRELIPNLAQKGYLAESTQTAEVHGFKRTWTTYKLTYKGENALRSQAPILLPVTDSMRETERLQEEKRQKVLAQLEENGIQRDKLPQDEVEKGDGEVIRAYSKWYTYLENLKKANKNDRVSQTESLLAAIENWRSETAVKMLIAPASVLAEHTLVSIAYTAATMPPGMKVDAESLVAAGVRTKEIGGLCAILGQWVDDVQPAPVAGSAEEAGASAAAMVLSELKPTSNWQYAVYKPQKKTGLATWESSYIRFSKGESPQTIAMSPANGRPIQANTVVGHILQAIEQGRTVDLNRLGTFMPAPTKSEWEQLQNAEMTTGMDVTGDPSCSGKDGEKFLMTDLIRPIVGDRLADLPYNERSEADKELMSFWFDRLKWYMALRRVDFTPTFDSI